MRSRLFAVLVLAALVSASASAQLPRPVRPDQANNHVRIKEWMFGARIGRTVTVATSGGDYSTLSAAIAYVTAQTPSSVAPWVILVYDGDHSAAPLTIPAWVSVIFLGGIDDDGDRSGLAVRTGTGYAFALKVTGATNIAGGGGGSGNSFETLNAPLGTDPVAESASDTLNLTCSGGLACTGTAGTDTLALVMPAYAASLTEGGPATTAIALAANGTNCPGGQSAAGVDASGNAEGCAAAGSGDVVGPASATANALVIYDSTTGKLLKNSGATYDAGVLTLPAGSEAAPSLTFGGLSAGSGLWDRYSNGLAVVFGGLHYFTFTPDGLQNRNGAQFRYAPAGEPTFTTTNDTATGMGTIASQQVGMWANSALAERWTFVAGSTARATTVGQGADAPQLVTCTDSGDGAQGAVTVNPTTPLVQITGLDPQGCVLTMGESNVTNGVRARLVVTATAGGTFDFADTPGVSELAGAFSAGLYDVLDLLYIADRWVETGRSDN